MKIRNKVIAIKLIICMILITAYSTVFGYTGTVLTNEAAMLQMTNSVDSGLYIRATSIFHNELFAVLMFCIMIAIVFRKELLTLIKIKNGEKKNEEN